MATKKQALNHCGRLKPGYRFVKGGKIIGNGKPKKAKPKKGATGSLF